MREESSSPTAGRATPIAGSAEPTDMSPDEFRRHGHAVMDRIADSIAPPDRWPVLPDVRPGSMVGAVQYWDGRVDDARLVLTVVRTAVRFGALAAIVSGSGPTVAVLAESTEGAIDLAVALTASGVAGDILRATGPVAGAHIIPTTRV